MTINRIPGWLTLSEAAAKTGYSNKYLYLLIRMGTIPATDVCRAGKTIMITDKSAMTIKARRDKNKKGGR